MTEAFGLLLAGGLAGAMAFFSFVAAPAAFRVLGEREAGTYVRAVFPVYFLVLALAAALAAMLIGFSSPAAGKILAVCAALLMAQRLALLPRIERHRAGREAGDPAATRAFRRLHGLSMALNLGVMVAAAAAVVAAA